MECAYSLSPQEADTGGYEFKASPSYVIRVYLKSCEIRGGKRRGEEGSGRQASAKIVREASERKGGEAGVERREAECVYSHA